MSTRSREGGGAGEIFVCLSWAEYGGENGVRRVGLIHLRYRGERVGREASFLVHEKRGPTGFWQTSA